MALKFRCTVVRSERVEIDSGRFHDVTLAVVETETLIDLIHALLNVLIDMVKEEKK